MQRRLTQVFSGEDVFRDGEFDDLGHADSPIGHTLTYCEAVFYLDAANANANVTCILTTPELADRVHHGKGLVVHAAPRIAFYRLHEQLHGGAVAGQTRIDASAIVSPTATIGKGVVISERVVIRDDVVIGDHCYIDAGAVVGAEGILYLREDGVNRRLPHRGGVRLGHGVTILANAVVVRGIFPGQPTRIHDHALVGISSVIGHEAILGRNSVVSGNCVVARGAIVGEDASIGTASVIREYIRIGDRASVKAGSVVISDVADDAEVSGNFAGPHRRRMLQHLKDLK